jgi:arylsulfatase A-like enzyme
MNGKARRKVHRLTEEGRRSVHRRSRLCFLRFFAAHKPASADILPRRTSPANRANGAERPLDYRGEDAHDAGVKEKKPDIIVIASDSLRQDHVSYYAGAASGAPTPHLDALLHECVAFDNMYPEGLPTIPVRTEWVTGIGTLAGRSWQPLSETDVTCAEILRREGYACAFITDVYHYFKPGQNFHRGYHEWQWVRGQEYDSCRSAPPRKRRVEDYWKEGFPRNWRDLLQVVCQNLDEAWHAKDFPCYKTFELAADWIRRNREQTKPLFLWAETFTPHEPWVPPIEFDTFKDPHYRGKDFILPPGGDASRCMTPDEIKRVRSLYAGEVAYLDSVVGEFVKALKDAGRYDSSLIFFLSDHGHPLADHGKFLKGPDRMHSELLKVPFGFKLPAPARGGQRVGKLAQFPDILPTLLDAAGLGNNLPALQGKSLLPLVRGAVERLREATISGYHSGEDRCIRDETWSLVLRPGEQADELYNLREDPKERHNVIEQHRGVAGHLAAKFGPVYAIAARPIKTVQGAFEVAHTPAG